MRLAEAEAKRRREEAEDARAAEQARRHREQQERKAAEAERLAEEERRRQGQAEQQRREEKARTGMGAAVDLADTAPEERMAKIASAKKAKRSKAKVRGNEDDEEED